MTAFLLSALGIGNSILKAALSWLSKQSPATLLCIVLALLLLVDHGALLMAHRHERKVEGQLAKTAKELKDEQAARAADRQAYTKAQTDAAAKNDAQIAHVKQQQKEISDAQVSTLNARLELIRSELRKQAGGAAERPSGGAQAGNASPAPCILNDPAWMCLSPEERLHAAENEERHDELIDWNLKQSSLDPNAGAGAPSRPAGEP